MALPGTRGRSARPSWWAAPALGGGAAAGPERAPAWRGAPRAAAAGRWSRLLALLLVPSLPVPVAADTSSIALPGGPPVSMDYLAYDAREDRVWVPAGNTGQVDVVEARTGGVRTVTGFPTARVTGRDGVERLVGPSSASPGDGFVYVGSRAGNLVCAVDARSLEKRGCVALASAPDGVAYVGPTHEVWVTNPRENAVTVLDVKSGAQPRIVDRVAVPHPEGYAVDPVRGLFYTNLEEEDRTLVFDVRTRRVVATYDPGCGREGPRGLALDAERRQLFVACTSKVVVLDAGQGGVVRGEIETGAGLDNIDYLPARHLVYAAAGRAGTLTVAEASAAGALTLVASTPAATGGRTVVVDARGTAYVADSRGGRLVVIR